MHYPEILNVKFQDSATTYASLLWQYYKVFPENFTNFGKPKISNCAVGTERT